MLCEQPNIRSSQRLFKIVRNRTRTPLDVFDLLDALERRAELYAAILDRNHSYWMDLPDAKRYIAELNLFRVRQPMPLLFATWEAFSKQDFVRVLKLVSAVSFRFSVVSGLNTNTLEPVYHRGAKAVTDGNITTLSEIFECLKPIYVEDQKMRQDFVLLEIETKGQKKKLAKYILARLEESFSSRTCDPDTDPGTIEHILPENPTQVWDGTYPSDKWERGVYRLGNLTLIEASLNREIGNGSYCDKLSAYSRSTYALARGIGKIAPEQWTEELVEERQRLLAARALQVLRSDFA